MVHHNPDPAIQQDKVKCKCIVIIFLSILSSLRTGVCVFASLFLKSTNSYPDVWEYSGNRSGLSTQPWRAPVLSTNIEEVLLPSQTLWGLLLWRQPASCPSVALTPRVFCFPVSFMGEIMLNAEPKSVNIILIYSSYSYSPDMWRLSEGQWI